MKKYGAILGTLVTFHTFYYSDSSHFNIYKKTDGNMATNIM